MTFASVSVFEDLQQIMASGIIERLETPVIEDQELRPRDGAHDTGVATVAACCREVGEELGHTLIEDGAIVAAGAVANGGRQPTLSHPGRPGEDQIVMGSDEGAAAELLEEGPVEPSRCLVIDIFSDGLMAELGVSKSGSETLVAAMGDLRVQ